MVTKVSKATLLISTPLGRKNGSETTKKNGSWRKWKSCVVKSVFFVLFLLRVRGKWEKVMRFVRFLCFQMSVRVENGKM